MKVCKFGGSSMASSDTIKRVAEIIKSDDKRKYVVVSAPGKRFLKDIKITDILRKDRNPAVPVTAPIEELLTRAMNQNFIPVTDDLGSLIGIVTRKTIIKYCTENGIKVK